MEVFEIGAVGSELRLRTNLGRNNCQMSRSGQQAAAEWCDHERSSHRYDSSAAARRANNATPTAVPPGR